VLINASPANFFAREEDQVDLLFVFDTDAQTDEDGRLVFHTEDDDASDIPLANRGQLTGLGMGASRTIGTGDDAVTLPAGIVFDEIEVLDIRLGAGNDTLRRRVDPQRHDPAPHRRRRRHRRGLDRRRPDRRQHRRRRRTPCMSACPKTTRRRPTPPTASTASPGSRRC
jgi:hypothetical protein